MQLQNPDDVEIPTVINTRAEDPAAFPIPTIYVCEINHIEILTVARDSLEEQVSLERVLKTSTHLDLYTDISETIIGGPVEYYHLTRVVKNSIYGTVWHALKLELFPSSEIPVGEMASEPPPFNWRGGGSYGLRHMTPHVEIAVKLYIKNRMRHMSGQTHENPLNEISAVQYLGHVNMWVMGQLGTYQDADNVYTLMEYCDGGELYDQLGDGPLTEEQSRRYFNQIVNGLEYCHSMGVAHRDMSLENLIYSRKGDLVKIIDFGMCLRVPKDEVTGAFLYLRPQGRCGKRNYIAPEVLQNSQPFNPMKADIWAIGVILFTMLSGFPPVESAQTADPRYRMISAGHLRTLIDNWNVSHLLSESVVGLIEGLMKPNPGDRFTMSEIIAHPWLHEGGGSGEVAPNNGGSGVNGSSSVMPPQAPGEEAKDDSMMEAG